MRGILGLKKISEHDHPQKECSAFTTSNVIRLQLFTFLSHLAPMTASKVPDSILPLTTEDKN